ncbi:sensor histidine kinase [Hippea sp. KM1]|uniref:sensor histidine kinase n=1 Tax=Hippea sp. KM1 TaxID=944481 RepID=UPI00046D7803|nr:ATP-binding protein [Hippea sp. KM1]
MSEDKLTNLKLMFEAVIQTSKKLEESYNQLKVKFEQLEGRLERNRKYLENILKSIDTGVCSVDSDGIIRTFNRKASSVFNLDEDGVKGKHFGEVFAIGELKDKGACQIVDYLKASKKITVNVGGEDKILNISASCVLEDETADGAVVVFSDITEMEKLKEENQKKEKLAIIGQMAASIAHDIKNPLASIELLVPLLDDGSKKDIVDNIMMSIKRINNIINNTLLFTKTINYAPENIKSLDFSQEVELEIYPRIKGSGVVFEKDVEAFDFVSDRNLLKSIAVNILTNAIEAARGRVVFGLKRTDEGVVLSVRDDGEGIDDVDKIFEPFYTNKKNGTGLGLAIVKQAVEILNGRIEIDTSINGSVFRVII